MDTYKNILAAVDFSTATGDICDKAAEVASRFQATLNLIHVVEPIMVDPVYDVVPAVPAELEVELVNQARQALSSLAERYAVAADRWWVDSGVTKTEILRRAELARADLIIVGSHGRHGVARLLGSTANAVLHSAQCDVLAVRVRS